MPLLSSTASAGTPCFSGIPLFADQIFIEFAFSDIDMHKDEVLGRRCRVAVVEGKLQHFAIETPVGAEDQDYALVFLCRASQRIFDLSLGVTFLG